MDNNINQVQPQQPVQPMPQYYAQPMPYVQNIPEEYKPISAWGYFGYELLFSIPLIGFIFLLIYALGGTRNINLKNFARSYFCALILVIIISIVMAVVFGVGLASYGVSSSR